jgi:hypothetical protein
MRRGLYVLLGVLLVPTVGLVGDIVTDGKFKSTQSSGAPLEVASPDMVANLNADMVDGVEGTDIYTKAQVDALVASVADSRPWYYLTTTPYAGSAADTACDSGFHMASMWEILNMTNLRYDTGRGMTEDDSGSGPPQFLFGWVRTGDSSYGGDVRGLANCHAWTSSDGSDYGTRAGISQYWDQPATEVSPWYVFVTSCDSPSYVWCVED